MKNCYRLFITSALAAAVASLASASHGSAYGYTYAYTTSNVTSLGPDITWSSQLYSSFEGHGYGNYACYGIVQSDGSTYTTAYGATSALDTPSGASYAEENEQDWIIYTVKNSSATTPESIDFNITTYASSYAISDSSTDWAVGEAFSIFGGLDDITESITTSQSASANVFYSGSPGSYSDWVATTNGVSVPGSTQILPYPALETYSLGVNEHYSQVIGRDDTVYFENYSGGGPEAFASAPAPAAIAPFAAGFMAAIRRRNKKRVQD